MPSHRGGDERSGRITWIQEAFRPFTHHVHIDIHRATLPSVLMNLVLVQTIRNDIPTTIVVRTLVRGTLRTSTYTIDI